LNLISGQSVAPARTNSQFQRAHSSLDIITSSSDWREGTLSLTIWLDRLFVP
jgi:hypothetical protein